MTELRIEPPQPFELIDADKARDVIKSTERALADLEREANRVTSAAEAAEAEARERGADLDGSPWTLVSLQGFLEQLRRDAERDAETMIDLATRKSRTMADDTVPNGAAPSPIVEPPARHAAPLPALPPPVVLVSPAEPPLERVEPPRVPRRPPADVWATMEPSPVVEEDATAETAPVATAPVAEPVPAGDPAPEPRPEVAPELATTAVEAAPAAEAPTPPAEPMVPEAELGVPPARFWPPPAPLVDDDLRASAAAQPEQPKKKRHFPLSAVLEVSAIVLILVFILLRLG